MQADQTVLSLRPGGGTGGWARLLAPRFDTGTSSGASSDFSLLRPHGASGGGFVFGSLKNVEGSFEAHERLRYTRNQLLQFREIVQPPEEIVKIKQEIELEIFGEEQSWGRADSNVQSQPQSRYSEPGNWRGRAAQAPASGEEGSRESIRDNKEYSSRRPESDPYAPNSRQQELNSNHADQLSSQFSSKLQMGASPALIKAEVPWSAQRGSLSEKERVLKTVKG